MRDLVASTDNSLVPWGSAFDYHWSWARSRIQHQGPIPTI